MGNTNIFELLENSGLLVGVFDCNKKLIEYNPPFAYYAEIIGGIKLKSGVDIMSKLDAKLELRFSGFLDRCLAGEKVREIIQYPFRSLTLHLRLFLSPINDETHPKAFMLLEDVTDFCEMQNQLDLYNRELEKLVLERSNQLALANTELLITNLKLEESIANLKLTQEQLIRQEKMAQLGTLSAGLCHEINNPLNFINGAVELLRRYDGQRDNFADRKEYFRIIKAGIVRISEIVSSLSLFSRNSFDLNEMCDVKRILSNCISILRNKLSKEIKLTLKAQTKFSLVLGNVSELHHAFFNILNNAQQSIIGEGTIEVRLKHVENELLIEVIDSGDGMSQTEQERALDPFFTTKPPGVGVGLGLSISNKIIEQHGGRLKITSILKKGTQVSILLPLFNDEFHNRLTKS
ncbi:MAG: ATP-binding protein [Ekhidna sp.]|uniref:sensor histidine kinase n=1 Tax=Ekhidna sp. TaxID=2608089 RepID=UPI0032EAEED2